MISLKARDAHGLSSDEVREKLEEARQELFNLRFQQATGALENTSRITAVRRDIARFLTVQGERAVKETN